METSKLTDRGGAASSSLAVTVGASSCPSHGVDASSASSTEVAACTAAASRGDPDEEEGLLAKEAATDAALMDVMKVADVVAHSDVLRAWLIGTCTVSFFYHLNLAYQAWTNGSCPHEVFQLVSLQPNAILLTYLATIRLRHVMRRDNDDDKSELSVLGYRKRSLSECATRKLSRSVWVFFSMFCTTAVMISIIVVTKLIETYRGDVVADVDDFIELSSTQMSARWLLDLVLYIPLLLFLWLWTVTMLLATTLALDRIERVIESVQKLETYAELWRSDVEAPARTLTQDIFPSLSTGWWRGLTICTAVDIYGSILKGRKSLYVVGMEWWRTVLGAVVYLLFLLLYLLPFATISSACEKLMDELNKRRVECLHENDDHICRLERALEKSNRGRGPGFVIYGVVINSSMLAKIATTIIAVTPTLLAVLRPYVEAEDFCGSGATSFDD